MTVSLPIAVLVALCAAPANAGPPPSVSGPLDPPDPADGMLPRPRDAGTSSVPVAGTAPLADPAAAAARPPVPGMPSDGSAPLGDGPTIRGEPSTQIPGDADVPLGLGPEPSAPEPVDPRLTRMFRLDFLLGPTWRIRTADTITTLGVAYGRMTGLSATVHTSFVFARDRDVVRVADIPIGAGAVLRGKLRNKPVYGSVGLTAGILVHRATIDQELIHRVDPDIRLPLRVAWTIADVGTSLAVVPGYSIRERTYERRGVEVWNRHSVRIALLIGLHWDIVAGRAQRRAPRRDGEH